MRYKMEETEKSNSNVISDNTDGKTVKEISEKGSAEEVNLDSDSKSDEAKKAEIENTEDEQISISKRELNGRIADARKSGMKRGKREALTNVNLTQSAANTNQANVDNMLFDPATGNILDQNNPDHQKIIELAKAEQVKEYSKNRVEEFKKQQTQQEQLWRHALDVQNKFEEQLDKVIRISLTLLKY